MIYFLLSSQNYTVKKDAYSSFLDEYNFMLIGLIAVLLLILTACLLYLKKLDKSKDAVNLSATLTKQEHRIVREILLGKTNSEISETLFISISTVKTHINNIYRKLNVASKEELRNNFETN